MSEGERLFAWARQLEDAAARWLCPGPTEEEARLLNLVVLEQFVEGLPEATARWVRCHQVPDLTTAVTLAEDHLVAEPPPAPQASRPRGGAACCCRLLLPPAARRRGGMVGWTERAGGCSPRNPFAVLLPAANADRPDANPEPRGAAQTRLLEVRTAGTSAPGLPANGGRSGVPRCWGSSTRSQSGRDIPHTGKVSRGYTPRFGGLAVCRPCFTKAWFALGHCWKQSRWS